MNCLLKESFTPIKKKGNAEEAKKWIEKGKNPKKEKTEVDYLRIVDIIISSRVD